MVGGDKLKAKIACLKSKHEIMKDKRSDKVDKKSSKPTKKSSVGSVSARKTKAKVSFAKEMPTSTVNCHLSTCRENQFFRVDKRPSMKRRFWSMSTSRNVPHAISARLLSQSCRR